MPSSPLILSLRDDSFTDAPVDFYRYQDKITTFTNPELAEGEGFTTVKTFTNRVSLHLSQQSNPIVGAGDML